MKIAERLGLGFGVLSLLLLVAAGSAAAMASASRSTSQEAKQYLAGTREVKQFQLDGEAVAVSENSIGFDYDSRSVATDDLNHLNANAAAFVADSRHVDALPLSASQRLTLDHAEQVFNVYIEQSRQANVDFAEGTPASAARANSLINNLAFIGVTGGLNRLAFTFSTDIDHKVRASIASANRARELVGALGAVGLLCAILLSVLITRSIVKPLGRTVQVLDAVADGDLTQSLAVTTNDEVGRMGHALNRTVGLLRHAMDDLTVLARTDALTGLANRSSFDSALSAALVEQTTGCSSVLFIDVDDFKYVNDALGHHGGDAVLVALADRLRYSIRSDDLCARLGGDEFAVLLRRADSLTAETIAQRIVDALAAPISVDDKPVTISVSIGVASDLGRTDPEQVVHQADIAMYSAKARGKNQLQVYRPELPGADEVRGVQPLGGRDRVL